MHLDSMHTRVKTALAYEAGAKIVGIGLAAVGLQYYPANADEKPDWVLSLSPKEIYAHALIEEGIFRTPVAFFPNRYTTAWGTIGFGLAHFNRVTDRQESNMNGALVLTGAQVVSTTIAGRGYSLCASGLGWRGLVLTTAIHGSSNLLLITLAKATTPA